MARIQALTQARSLSKTDSPLSSTSVGGSDGVPKMHSLKSSNPIFRATNIIHMAKMKKVSLPKFR